MEVKFREFDPFNVWFWLKFSTLPSNAEKQYVEEVFDSWFFLGKLGGFNAENLQVQDQGIDLSHMEYDPDTAANSMMALMHNMGDVEYNGLWARCWFDLGTSDGIALDILINSLQQLSGEFVAIETFILGGVNEDWPIEENDAMSPFIDHN